MEYLKKKI